MLTAHQQYRKDAAERKRTVIRLYKRDVPQVEIAKQVGLTRERVRQIINEHKESKT